MKITITISQRGLPVRRITGIWPTTCDAALFAMDLAGAGAAISVRRAA